MLRYLLVFVAAFATGCNTASVDGLNVAPQAQETLLTGGLFNEIVVGNSLFVVVNSRVTSGKVEVHVHYRPDGTARDRLFYPASGTTDRSEGTWFFSDPERGVLCTRFERRFKGEDRCSILFLREDGTFRAVPQRTGARTLIGKLVSGDATAP